MHSTRTFALVAGLAGAAHAQSFTNGDFATGDLTGWTVVNTANGVGAPGSVVPIDIDGPGPLGSSNAAMFTVGQAVFTSGMQAGIEMTQGLSLSGGVAYTFDVDWSAQRTSATNNAEGGVFSLIVGGTALATQNAPNTSSATPHYGHIHVVYTPPSTAVVAAGIRITRPYLGGPTSGAFDVMDYVDNIAVSGGSAPPPCYANCDASTTAPVLNVLDFNCFLNRFAAGDSYANCDGSTTVPVLNVLDFNCFLNQFAAGCS